MKHVWWSTQDLIADSDSYELLGFFYSLWILYILHIFDGQYTVISCNLIKLSDEETL